MMNKATQPLCVTHAQANIIFYISFTMCNGAFTLQLALRIGEQKMLNKRVMKTSFKEFEIKPSSHAIINYV